MNIRFYIVHEYIGYYFHTHTIIDKFIKIKDKKKIIFRSLSQNKSKQRQQEYELLQQRICNKVLMILQLRSILRLINLSVTKILFDKIEKQRPMVFFKNNTFFSQACIVAFSSLLELTYTYVYIIYNIMYSSYTCIFYIVNLIVNLCYLYSRNYLIINLCYLYSRYQTISFIESTLRFAQSEVCLGSN